MIGTAEGEAAHLAVATEGEAPVVVPGVPVALLAVVTRALVAAAVRLAAVDQESGSRGLADPHGAQAGGAAGGPDAAGGGRPVAGGVDLGVALPFTVGADGDRHLTVLGVVAVRPHRLLLSTAAATVVAALRGAADDRLGGAAGEADGARLAVADHDRAVGALADLREAEALQIDRRAAVLQDHAAVPEDLLDVDRLAALTAIRGDPLAFRDDLLDVAPFEGDVALLEDSLEVDAELFPGTVVEEHRLAVAQFAELDQAFEPFQLLEAFQSLEPAQIDRAVESFELFTALQFLQALQLLQALQSLEALQLFETPQAFETLHFERAVAALELDHLAEPVEALQVAESLEFLQIEEALEALEVLQLDQPLELVELEDVVVLQLLQLDQLVEFLELRDADHPLQFGEDLLDLRRGDLDHLGFVVATGARVTGGCAFLFVVLHDDRLLGRFVGALEAFDDPFELFDLAVGLFVGLGDRDRFGIGVGGSLPGVQGPGERGDDAENDADGRNGVTHR